MNEITIRARKVIPVEENKYYVEIDGIRFIVEDGRLTGWYDFDRGGENDGD